MKNKLLHWIVAKLCDSTGWTSYRWYRKWRGGVWYHIRICYDMGMCVSTFWSRYGAGDFEMIERDLEVEIYAYDWQRNLLEVGDMVKICSYAVRKPEDRDRTFMVNGFQLITNILVWVKLSDGNSYSPEQLMLVSGKEQRERSCAEF